MKIAAKQLREIVTNFVMVGTWFGGEQERLWRQEIIRQMCEDKQREGVLGVNM